MEDDYPQVVLGSKLFDQRISAVQLSRLLNSELFFFNIQKSTTGQCLKI